MTFVSKKYPLMSCGHTAQGHRLPNKEPCCVICSCIEVAKVIPDISNRTARCYCGKTVKSNFNLAFFEVRLNKNYDIFYCGCDGWD
jgi:hypothetical protein